MNRPRRAARSTGASLSLLRLAGALFAGSLAFASAAFALVGVRMARKVVTPAVRVADTVVEELDTSAQTITLSRTADSALPGRYGLFTNGPLPYLKVGAVLGESTGTVKRKLLTHISDAEQVGRDAAFSGWYFDRPEQLHLPFRPELIGGPLGPCPAWVFPADADDADLWVIQVHGRGAARAEALRAVPLMHDLGMTSLLVSYRNDGEGPRSRSGLYGLGGTEWRDVDAALGFARRNGARRVLLMGWSMGGAIVLQVALSSAHRDLIAGVVLDSPVLDWRVVLDFHAAELGVPAAVADLAIGVLGSKWAHSVAGLEEPIPFARLDVVSRAQELQRPVLILHSDDDGFVPSDASHDLVVARPDLVRLEVFEGARHTKLWNYDQERWSRSITTWLRAEGIIAERTAEGS